MGAVVNYFRWRRRVNRRKRKLERRLRITTKAGTGMMRERARKRLIRFVTLANHYWD